MNGGIFSTSRMLFGLSGEKSAPKAFGVLNKNAVPANALYFTVACLVGGAILQSTSDSLQQAFTITTTLTTILCISVWLIIMWSYINFVRKRPELYAQNKFKLPGGLVTCAFVIVFLFVTVFILCLEPDTLLAVKWSPVWLIILAIGYFGFYKRQQK